MWNGLSQREWETALKSSLELPRNLIRNRKGWKRTFTSTSGISSILMFHDCCLIHYACIKRLAWPSKVNVMHGGEILIRCSHISK